MSGEIDGREEELGAVSAFLDRAPEAPAALVLEGDAGIGKSTLWLAGVDTAREREHFVLVAGPPRRSRASRTPGWAISSRTCSTRCCPSYPHRDVERSR